MFIILFIIYCNLKRYHHILKSYYSKIKRYAIEFTSDVYWIKTAYDIPVLVTNIF
jgi:hypothetical protein